MEIIPFDIVDNRGAQVKEHGFRIPELHAKSGEFLGHLLHVAEIAVLYLFRDFIHHEGPLDLIVCHAVLICSAVVPQELHIISPSGLIHIILIGTAVVPVGTVCVIQFRPLHPGQALLDQLLHIGGRKFVNGVFGKPLRKVTAVGKEEAFLR